MTTPPTPVGESRWLAVDGAVLRDANGAEVRLRGVGVGGWLNMENFITGYPGTESLHRSTMRAALGPERADRLFARFLTAFFGDEDTAFLASLGLNTVRIPVNYHHLQEDLEPDRIRAGAFDRLDRAVRAGAEVGLWTVIDLHALPGAQNHHWHSDNPFFAPQLWSQRDYQDRTVAIWEAIAEHYREEPWVAGYNLINEPADESTQALVELHARLAAAIRNVDPRHILFLEGNRYGRDFDGFGDPITNAVYAFHQYPAPGSVQGGPYPGVTAGHHWDKAAVATEMKELTRYQRTRGVPAWAGEFGPVYSGNPETDASRRTLLRDQLDLYESAGIGWSLWAYKDIGLQGLVSAAPDSPWMARTEAVRAKKVRLGVDSWGSNGAGVEDLIAPLVERVTREFPLYKPYPYGIRRHIELLIRHILLAEPLAAEFAAVFADASEAELDVLADCFAFANCVHNEALCELVASAAANT